MSLFYKIHTDLLEVGKIFDVPLFLYDRMRDRRFVVLYPHTKIQEDDLEDWKIIEEKGGHLQIIQEDIEEFCQALGIDIQRVTDLNTDFIRLKALEEKRLDTYKSWAQKAFDFKTTLQHCSNLNDFLPLIKRVKTEVLCFPLRVNTEVSTVTKIVDDLFVRDLFNVRMAAFAYFLAQTNGIKDPESLSSILLASLLKDAGINQIPFSRLIDKATRHNTPLYLKHPMLSIYVISKSGIELSNLTKRIILEHQEISDGSGYPRGKTANFIHPLTHFIVASDSLFSYMAAEEKKGSRNLLSGIRLIVKELPNPDLIIQYPNHIIKLLEGLLPRDPNRQEADQSIFDQ